jgi:hypothetical protein
MTVDRIHVQKVTTASESKSSCTGYTWSILTGCIWFDEELQGVLHPAQSLLPPPQSEWHLPVGVQYMSTVQEYSVRVRCMSTVQEYDI